MFLVRSVSVAHLGRRQKVVIHFLAVIVSGLLMGSSVQAAPPSTCFGVAAGEVDPALPAYRPQPFELPRKAGYITSNGAIVVIGYNDMREMLQAMTSRFNAAHPRVHFQLDLPGTRFAPAALAKGQSAFAPMGAQFTPPQLEEYRHIAHSEPLAVRIAHASLDPRALSGPLAVFVHRDNPIRSLTLAQVANVFAGDVAYWRELGVIGEWSNRRVSPYGIQPGTALAFELQQAVMPGRPIGANVVGVPQSVELIEKVTADPSAIGFAAAMRAKPGVRALAIARNEGAEPVAPTCENIVAGRYPLDRYLLIYLSRPITPLAREFVRFALSRDGQETVTASPQRYLPLSAREAATELERIE
jgi:phosphate transport system substrate-binding protein